MFNEKIKFDCPKIVVMLVVIKIYYGKTEHEKKSNLIYMLLWSGQDTDPFRFWAPKRKSLNSLNCTFQNCYIVKERDYFPDVTDYDAILFTVKGINKEDLPLARSDNQLYVFVSGESPTYFSYNNEWNWFFNYTWTYKLDSDIVDPYFLVKNMRGEIVGPKINAHWRNISRMRPTKGSVIGKLKNKTLAAAWFVTNCDGNTKRLDYGFGLNRALSKYNLNVDIYGDCGDKICPKGAFYSCLKEVELKYYFYLAFENSYHEDYVTEKLTSALEHYTVPIVLGGANYLRFMPDGIYINANTISEDEVAAKINEAIQDKQKYYDYFKWHRYYTYRHAEGDGDEALCAFCALLNDESKRNQRRVYARFDKWWNEYRNENDSQDIIVKFDDSGPYIKSIVTYREAKVEVKTVVSDPTVLEEVNSFVGSILSYYFGD